MHVVRQDARYLQETIAILRIRAYKDLTEAGKTEKNPISRTMRIQLVEDHPQLASLIKKGLESADFQVDVFRTGKDALEAHDFTQFDAMILDLGLPDTDGLKVLDKLRKNQKSLPILILTSRVQIGEVVKGLDQGADDYMTKPFAMEELLARLHALLRRPGTVLGKALITDNLELDTGAREVRVDGSPVRLSPREIEALELLMRRSGKVVPKTAMESSLYGMSETLSSNSVEVIVHRLRRKIEAAGADCAIKTVHGVGYMLIGKNA